MIRLIRELIRPYRGSLLIILLAMLVETAMSLATPWPLKIIIDNVVGSHKLSPWLVDLLRPWMDGKHQLHIAALAAFAYVIIALLGALATYIDNYYTESVGQYVAHDLRMRTFNHLQRLSLARIIRDFEDKRSLLCYKHGDYSLFGALPEASS